jgi:hypothetical protein
MPTMLKIPFTVYARIIPERTHNKRRTYTKSIEKIAKYVADDINAYADANPDTININQQLRVSSTPQFAQKSARLTITGWDIHVTGSGDDLANLPPASQINYDAPFTSAEDDNYDGTPGKVVSGYRGTQYLSAQGQTIDPQVIIWMQNLKSLLESLNPYLDDIYRIEYNGIAFGEDTTAGF